MISGEYSSYISVLMFVNGLYTQENDDDVIICFHISDRINQCDQRAVVTDGSRSRGAKTTANSNTVDNNKLGRTTWCTSKGKIHPLMTKKKIYLLFNFRIETFFVLKDQRNQIDTYLLAGNIHSGYYIEVDSYRYRREMRWI